MLCPWLFVLAKLILRISFRSDIIRQQSMNRLFGTWCSSFKRSYKLKNGFNNICDCIGFSAIWLTRAIINFKLLFYPRHIKILFISALLCVHFVLLLIVMWVLSFISFCMELYVYIFLFIIWFLNAFLSRSMNPLHRRYYFYTTVICVS